MLPNSKIRLVTKVAQLYYEKGCLQKQIAKQLHLSQATISRLLKVAKDEEIVRMHVNIPTGVYSRLESELEEAYGLKEVIIADTDTSSPDEIIRSIANAAAYYLETTLADNEVIGISSWSTTLLAMVKTMQPIKDLKNTKVVQILGGLGNPAAETHANHLIKRLSSVVNGESIFLPAPGVMPKHSSPDIYKQDEYVKRAIDMFNKVTIALVGIGTIQPSRLLANSGNFFSSEELNKLKKQGAIGDICIHFIDKNGNPIHSSLDDRVMGMSLKQIKKVPRTIGIAGGEKKAKAIKAVLKGKYIDVLITDKITAELILKN